MRWCVKVVRWSLSTNNKNFQPPTNSQSDKATHPHNRFSASHSRSLPTRLETFIFPNRYRQESILIDGTGECVYIHICFKNRKILFKKNNNDVLYTIYTYSSFPLTFKHMICDRYMYICMIIWTDTIDKYDVSFL